MNKKIILTGLTLASFLTVHAEASDTSQTAKPATEKTDAHAEGSCGAGSCGGAMKAKAEKSGDTTPAQDKHGHDAGDTEAAPEKTEK